MKKHKNIKAENISVVEWLEKEMINDVFDKQSVEGFSNKEPNDCWKVADGEFAGNVMEKKHCF
jgi:hypothetical protein